MDVDNNATDFGFPEQGGVYKTSNGTCLYSILSLSIAISIYVHFKLPIYLFVSMIGFQSGTLDARGGSGLSKPGR